MQFTDKHLSVKLEPPEQILSINLLNGAEEKMRPAYAGFFREIVRGMTNYAGAFEFNVPSFLSLVSGRDILLDLMTAIREEAPEVPIIALDAFSVDRRACAQLEHFVFSILGVDAAVVNPFGMDVCALTARHPEKQFFIVCRTVEEGGWVQAVTMNGMTMYKWIACWVREGYSGRMGKIPVYDNRNTGLCISGHPSDVAGVRKKASSFPILYVHKSGVPTNELVDALAIGANSDFLISVPFAGTTKDQMVLEKVHRSLEIALERDCCPA